MLTCFAGLLAQEEHVKRKEGQAAPMAIQKDLSGNLHVVVVHEKLHAETACPTFSEHITSCGSSFSQLAK